MVYYATENYPFVCCYTGYSLLTSTYRSNAYLLYGDGVVKEGPGGDSCFDR
jgi:hypothetical protein